MESLEAEDILDSANELADISKSSGKIVKKLVDHANKFSAESMSEKDLRVTERIAKLSLDYLKISSSNPILVAEYIKRLTSDEKQLLHKHFDKQK